MLIKPRLSVLIPSDFPEGVSANARTKCYVDGLSAIGYNIDILVGYSTSVNKSNINQKYRDYWQGIPFLYACRTTKYYQNRIGKLYIFIRFIAGTFGYILRNLSVKKMWVVYDPTMKDFSFALPILKFLRQNVVTINTEMFSLLNKQAAARINEKIIARYSDAILVVSENLFKYYCTVSQQEVTKIVPIVADTKRFNNIQYKKSKTLGYLGTFGDKDGVLFIIDGFLKVAMKIPNLKLYLMGFIPDKEVLLLIKNICGKHENISYSGQVHYNNIPNELEKCDTLIMNRIDSSYAKTGFPIKLAEYLATGIPVLLCDFPEYHNYLDGTEVIFFEANNIDSIVQAIEWRYQNYTLANEIGLNGQSACEKLFSMNVAANELNDIFVSLNQNSYQRKN